MFKLNPRKPMQKVSILKKLAYTRANSFGIQILHQRVKWMMWMTSKLKTLMIWMEMGTMKLKIMEMQMI